MQAALPSRAGTIKHVYKKRKTKQAQHQGIIQSKWRLNMLKVILLRFNISCNYKKSCQKFWSCGKNKRYKFFRKLASKTENGLF